MSKPIKDRPVAEDGCYYMTENEIRAFQKMAVPSPFDHAAIKNKSLNIQYGSLPEQLLDVYMPEASEGPLPVVFYVHGGGWTMGSKTEGFLGGIIGLIDHGYAVISVDYRLAPKAVFPEFIFDVKTAVRWARAHAHAYNFDPSRFGMAGDSAGGHITLMMGFTANRPEYAGEKYGWPGFSDELEAICDMYGPSMLDASGDELFRESGVPRLSREKPGEPAFFGAVFGTTAASLLGLISPISYVHKNIPPTLILQGVKDGVVAYQHSTLLAEKIAGICGESKVKLVLYEDRNHADYGFNTKENSDVIAAYFDHYLK